jgi:hypothetical protein
MNYQKIYDDIVFRGADRKRVKKGTPDYVYYELHHIIPCCLGGANNKTNLVLLTAEEHWVAHLLLVKIYPRNNKLIFACQAMSMTGGNSKRTTNKMFGWIRRAYGEATSQRQKGRIVTQEQRDKISKALTGRAAPHQKGNNNVSKRPDVAKKISNAAKNRTGRETSDTTKLKISQANTGHRGLTGIDNHAKLRACCVFCQVETSLSGIGRNHKLCK